MSSEKSVTILLNKAASKTITPYLSKFDTSLDIQILKAENTEQSLFKSITPDIVLWIASNKQDLLDFEQLSKRLTKKLSSLFILWNASTEADRYAQKTDLEADDIFYSTEMLEESIAKLKIWIKLSEERKASAEFKKFHLQVSELTGQAIYRYHIDSGKVEWHGNAKKFFGLTEAERKNRDLSQWENSLHPEDKAYAIHRLKEAVKSRKNFNCIYRIKHKEGHYFYVEDTASILPGKNGNSDELVGCIRNINEVYEAQEKLKQKEERFRGLVESSSDIIWETDHVGKYSYVSPNVHKIFGYEVSEVIGKSPDQFLKQKDAEVFRKNFMQLIKEPQPFTRMLSNKVHKNGSLVKIETSGVPVLGSNGEFKGYRGISRDVSKETTIANSLEATNLKHNSLVEMIDGIYWHADPDTLVCDYVSPQLKDILGFMPSEWLADEDFWFKHIHPQDREKVINQFMKLVEDRKGSELEYRMINKDGNIIWVKDIITILFDKRTEKLSISGVIIDISGKRQLSEVMQAENEVLEYICSGGTLEKALNLLLQKIETISTSDIYTSVHLLKEDNKLYTVSAPSIETALSKEINAIPPGSISGSCGAAAYVKKPVLVQDIRKSALWVNHKGPLLKYGYLSAYSFPIMSSKKKVLGTFSAYYKSTEKIKKIDSDLISRAQYIASILIEKDKNEKAFHLQRKMLREITRNFPGALWQLTYNEKQAPYFNFISDGITKLFNMTPEALYLKPLAWLENVYQEDQAAILQTISDSVDNSSLESKETTIEFRYKTTKAGEYKWYKLLSRYHGTHNGLPVFNGLLIDESEQKQTEKILIRQNEELKQINLELDSLVYSTSHDLRAPLTSVLGLIDISRTEKSEESKKHYLDLMEHSINRLDQTIKDIMLYAKNKRKHKEYAEIDFLSIINEIIDNHSHIEHAKTIKTKIEVEGDIKFTSDMFRIKIILNNLISNAFMHHNPDRSNSFINILITKSKHTAKIVIEDNGKGISKKHVEKIYDMFYKANTKSKGTGLGLYIVKEAVSKLGGKIELKTEEKKGTKFTILLPNMAD